MKDKKQIEVELRGPLSYKNLKFLSTTLKKEGKFLGRKKQMVIFFQENKILNLPKDSLRIIKDQNSEKVCFKLKSKFGANQEFEFLLKRGEYKKATVFFQSIGFVNYTVSPALRKDFLYKGATFSLKWECIIGPHFEAEKIVNNKNEIKKAEKRLSILISELGLKAWTKKEYLKHKDYYWNLFRKDGRLK